MITQSQRLNTPSILGGVASALPLAAPISNGSVEMATSNGDQLVHQVSNPLAGSQLQLPIPPFGVGGGPALPPATLLPPATFVGSAPGSYYGAIGRVGGVPGGLPLFPYAGYLQQAAQVQQRLAQNVGLPSACECACACGRPCD